MRRKDTHSLAVIAAMPTITTAVRVRPAHQTHGRRKRVYPFRGQAGNYVIDEVLPEQASNEHSYQCILAPLVDGFVEGESAVLLLYGANHTGKTYTLQGNVAVSNADPGLIQYAAVDVIKRLAIVPQHKYRLAASYSGLGVGHDAQLIDFLSASGTGIATAAATSLRDSSAAAALAGLTAWNIIEPNDVDQVLKCRDKQVPGSAGAAVNRTSFSRTPMHTMLTMQLDSLGSDGTVLGSTYLSFVELAAPKPKDVLGHSNVSKGADNANARSLAMAYNSLGKVLAALRHTAPVAPTTATLAPSTPHAARGLLPQQQWQQQLQRLPWRDSPVTRWLQERLDSAAVVKVLGTVSAAPEASVDTLATICWVSRFSNASRSGAGGVLVTFAWDMLAANSEGATGSYLRINPGPTLGFPDPCRSQQVAAEQQQQQTHQQHMAQPRPQHSHQQQQQQQSAIGMDMRLVIRAVCHQQTLKEHAHTLVCLAAAGTASMLPHIASRYNPHPCTASISLVCVHRTTRATCRCVRPAGQLASKRNTAVPKAKLKGCNVAAIIRDMQ